MTDVADEIRRKLEEHPPGQRTMPPSSLRSQTIPGHSEMDEAFMKLRARVRGALIAAHRELVGDEWGVTDDRILDIVSTWLEAKRGK